MPADVVTATLDVKPLLDAMNAIGRVGGRRVQQRAIRGGTRGMRTEAIAQAYKILPITKSRIGKAIPIPRAARSKVDGEVRIIPKSVPLVLLSARQTKKGVTFKAKRAGKRSRIIHGFISTMDSGHIGVFERDPRKGSNGKRPPRLPIRELFGQQVVQAVDGPKQRRAIIERGENDYRRELLRLIDVELAKKG